MYGHPNYASWSGFSMSSRQVHVPKHTSLLSEECIQNSYGFARKRRGTRVDLKDLKLYIYFDLAGMKPWTRLADMRALPVLGHYTCSHGHFGSF